MSEYLNTYVHCGTAQADGPFLVPPTWNKSRHQSGIENVWKQAAQELAESENIFVIGYSLPQTDLFFHYLLSLGCLSSQIIRRFWVFDINPAVEERYRQILGPGVANRFQFIELSFKDVVRHLTKEIKPQS